MVSVWCCVASVAKALLLVHFLSCLHIIINLQEQANCFCGELESARRDQQWLDDILFQDIGDQTLQTMDVGRVLANERNDLDIRF